MSDSKIDQHDVHTFDNGVKVFKRHLIPVQLERYMKINLHEPEEEYWFLRVLNGLRRDSEVVIADIGAAIGYYSILSKITLPHCKVVSYEPLNLHRKYLLENWELNGLEKKDLTVSKYAIYSSKSRQNFENRLYGSHIRNPEKERKHKLWLMKLLAFDTTTVKTVLLDDEVKKYGTFSLAKIDVQGSEVQVLRGASLSLRQKLIKSFVIGTHSKPIHEECIMTLREFGYHIPFEKIDPVDQPDGIIVAGVTAEIF